MNTDTPETACADCGSTEESYFSRIEPMGYFCPDCGHEEGKPVERQCDNQVDQMTNITDTPETDEALSTAECESDLVIRMRRMERERDEWKAKYIWQNKDLGCELRDPNGTIWDHAKTLQRERDERRATCAMLGENMAVIEFQLAEAREQLAEIEAKMRAELGGHPNSQLWGEAGLIAATMRCVDALGEVTDQRDEAKAESIRWQSIAEGRGRTDDEEQLATVTAQRDRLAEALHKVSRSWNYAEVAQQALQSLTPNAEP
jgi:hypothetical protein